jgi:hypothetical protein
MLDFRAYFTHEHLKRLSFHKAAFRTGAEVFRAIGIDDAILMPFNSIAVFDKRPHDHHDWVGIY